MILERTTKIFLFASLIAPSFLVLRSLLFPCVAGKIYLFRLFVLVSFILWIFLAAKNPRYRINFRNLLVISLVLMFAGLVIAALLGIDPVHSFFSDFERSGGVMQFGFWLLYFLLLISVFKSKKDWMIFLSIFSVLALAISLYSWVSSGWNFPLYGSTFCNPAYFSAFLIFAIGFSFSLFALRKGEKFFRDFLLLFSAVFILTATLFLTGTRGAYLGLAGGGVLASLLTFFFLKKKKLALLAILFLIVLIVLTSQFYLFGKGFSEIWESASFKERLFAWSVTLQAFQDKPVLGWGPENFQSAFNKHYDFQVSLSEPWFDKAHNQLLNNLAEGGIVLLSLYCFWVFSVFYTVYRIFQKEKLLGIILSSTFFAYLVQSFFLFDTFASNIGLFPFLALLYSYHQSICSEERSLTAKRGEIKGRDKVLVPLGLLAAIFFLAVSVWIPYKSNNLVWEFSAAARTARPEVSEERLEKSFEIETPVTFLPIRKRAGWELLNLIESKDKGAEAGNIYNKVTSELEEARKKHPYDPQTYFLLGKLYRLGYERLGKNDLGKGERALEDALLFSDLRTEYINELARILVLQEKYQEAESLIEEYDKKTEFSSSLSHLLRGHIYFSREEYQAAMEEYQEAKEKGARFWEREEFSNYLFAAEKIGDYQKVVEACSEYLSHKEPKAEILFNLAVAHRELNNFSKAVRYFDEAVELDNSFKEYSSFFEFEKEE